MTEEVLFCSKKKGHCRKSEFEKFNQKHFFTHRANHKFTIKCRGIIGYQFTHTKRKHCMTEEKENIQKKKKKEGSFLEI